MSCSENATHVTVARLALTVALVMVAHGIALTALDALFVADLVQYLQVIGTK